jgi:hypothetical protein
MKKKLLIAAGAFASLLVVLSLLGAGDVIDLPAWANVKGVDIPLVGDTDTIDCKLEQIDDTPSVSISVVDGDKSTYASYVHVWNNGNLVDPDLVERVTENAFVVPSTDGVDEQFYSISIEPSRDVRVFCESVVLK